jgi:hypothetical protein
MVLPHPLPHSSSRIDVSNFPSRNFNQMVGMASSPMNLIPTLAMMGNA